MSTIRAFKLSGIAVPKDADSMLEQVCDHFVEHADVARTAERALLTSKLGSAELRIDERRLLIELDCPSNEALHMSRILLAEHLFYFAGEDALELTWSDPAAPARLPNIHYVTVASVEDVTPRMRRVKFACADVTPFIGGDMHVRLLVPPRGRTPVWPGLREDGRVAWPEGEDALLVRVYTIRAVDAERGELWIDFLQHPACGVETPGADFARDAEPGEKVALLGPGGGGLPVARTILLAGDESALPAIARIAADVAPGTRMRAIIEVEDDAEEQPLPSHGSLEVQWLHRRSYLPGSGNVLREETKKMIQAFAEDTFIWFACEKDDVRAMRSHLKALGHDKKKMYVAWYWERNPG